MKFAVPQFLRESIEIEPEIQSCVSHALSALFPWFLDNKLFFFPEFTDHGVDHINTVLATADSLISKAARSSFSPADSGALIIAVLLHDCAMHLSWDGFRTLLSGEYVATSKLLKNQQKPWPELFNSFLHTAERWDQEKLIQVLGADRPIRIPPEKLIDTNESDRRLVGEFLRIHHARLAHEIALIGIPGPLASRETWIKPLNTEVLPPDLIGLIARSHNMSLRSAKDLLPRHRRRSFSEIHAPYVMAILRIADYLQIQSKRAHPSLLGIRSLQSSISILEWKKHASITDIHKHGDDPEALVVHCTPTDVATLFSLKSLFSSMQQELDNTWAALGEVYGGDVELQALGFEGLTIRRLQTNVSNLESFEKREHPPFVPEELKLKSAGAEMFNLLVGPLYDNDASVAVREMVQNSVDACTERTRYEKSIGKSPPTPQVNIYLEINQTGSSYLRIIDNGIGMHLNTIKEYFLVAGASFRKSQWWKSAFVDSAGKSSVQRSGRFGVGALAAFLAGDSTTVTTRHADDTSGLGLTFKYSIDDKFVEAKRIATDIGTEIKIEITDEKIKSEFRKYKDPTELRLHWYGLKTPLIKCDVKIDSEPVHSVERKFNIPQPSDSTLDDWESFSAPGYSGVLWTFKRIAASSYPRHPLFCNGIYISDRWSTKTPLEISPGSPSINFGYPSLSVFDPDGNFPINLARNSIAASTLPFKTEYEESLADYFTRESLRQWGSRKGPSNEVARDFAIAGTIENHVTYLSIISSLFIRSKDGACPLDAALISTLQFNKILVVPRIIGRQKELIKQYLAIPGNLVVECSVGYSTKSDVEAFFRVMMGGESRDNKFLKQLGRTLVGRGIFSSNSALAIAKEKNRVPRYYFQNWKSLELGASHVITHTGDFELSEETSVYEKLAGESGFVAEFIFADDSAPVAPTTLSKAWMKNGRLNALLEN